MLKVPDIRRHEAGPHTAAFKPGNPDAATSRRALSLIGLGAVLLPGAAWAAGSGVVGENLL